jgi:hypothetical protein
LAALGIGSDGGDTEGGCGGLDTVTSTMK